MEEEYKSQESQAVPKPPMPNPAPTRGGKAGQSDDSLTFGERSEFNWSRMFLWLAAIIALVAAGTFWFLNYSATTALAEKNDEKTKVVNEITSKTYADVEKQATAFKSAVDQLQAAVDKRYSMTDFLPQLYGKINKNVVVTSLAVDSDGKIAIDGTTDKYQSVAKQMETLSSWVVGTKNVLSDVQLLSVSESTDGGVIVTFSLSAQIDKTVKLSSTGGN